MVPSPEDRRGVIHDAAGNPDRSLLRAAAEFGQGHRLQTEVGCLAERHRHGDGECGRRRQSSFGRKVRADLALDPDRSPPERVQLRGNRRREPCPPLAAARTVGRNRGRLTPLRTQLDTVGAARDLKPDASVDRRRKRETPTVVRVLTDQIDASRRTQRDHA